MNLQEEYRNGYLVTAQVKKVWNIELQLLSKLLEVCQKHNLRVWADSGTLLGAVRHQGFIPWDDDIDVAMPREDYEQLKRIAPTEFNAPYFFQCAYTDKYVRGHAQLRYDGTTAILHHEIGVPFHQGIFIDIFVLDVLPKDKQEQWNIMRKTEMLRKLMTWAVIPFDFHHRKRAIAQIFCKAYFLFHSLQKTYAKFERMFYQYQSLPSQYVGMPMFSVLNILKYRMKRDWYSETVTLPFEDIEVPVPKHYHEILTEYYGDYMTPQQVPTAHGTIILDADKPYQETLKELRSNSKHEHGQS